jgi:hypothetical protein
MTNRLRTEIQEETEVVPEVQDAPKKDIPENVFTSFFTKGVISTEAATNALPFILFLTLLGMLYIGNMHMAENTIRKIDKLDKEVKELGWDYKTTKADLAFKSTLSEVIKRVDTLGLKEPVAPPQKIVVKEDRQ